MILSFRYALPSRRTFTKMLPELYTKVMCAIMKLSDTWDSVGITLDMWTSVTTTSFLGVTAHFINKKVNY